MIPDDLTPEGINARFGASWIPVEIVQQFLRETLDDAELKVEHHGGGFWAVKGSRHSVLATSTWAPTATRHPTWLKRSWNSASRRCSTTSAPRVSRNTW
ncbi:hypothetical protein [Nonomuraea soli]|uniref:N12 class adenine-specific DNA methylase n=1 Tax=Nonomuraea soli TaxID=1032476 RepID=A0A7W0CV47_9ACTN|nr:hypothetical protein [Nonomuraea soli]MBA2897723.1 N12 class adenine-specific DNA methylase [Nonomuraea soli]